MVLRSAAASIEFFGNYRPKLRLNEPAKSLAPAPVVASVSDCAIEPIGKIAFVC